MARGISSDAALDRLYQAPLGEFVAERNALAKESGRRAPDVRALQKPSVPAWAVNQLFWRSRAVYDQLIARAEDLRATHNAALRGKRADLRGASKAHEQAVDAALKATLALLAAHGHPVTDATKQAVATTLRGLPGDEAPGRLTRPLQPRGFDMLAGAGSPGKVRVAPPAAKSARQSPPRRDTFGDTAARRAAAKASLAAAKEALAAAARATRDAEQAARREEFEVARTVRDADKARQRVNVAEEAVREAESALADAEREAAAAEEARDGAQVRAAQAAGELEKMRAVEDKARAALDELA